MNAPARIAELERQLHWAQLKIQSLEELLRQQRIQQLGPKSETLSNLQLQLLADEEPSATREEVEAEARREVLRSTTPRESKPHPGRKPLPENLPHVTMVIACSERTCASCGKETAVIGYDESEQLDVEPALFCARDQTREASLPALLERDGGSAGRAHYRKRISQRCGGDQRHRGEIL